MQHIIHHLAPGGAAGFVLANGSMSSNQSGEGDIRKAIIEAGLVDCMVALPGQLFYSTQIPACLWFLRRRPPGHEPGRVLFIDARQMGTMTDRTHRDLTDEDIARIADTYHAWKTTNDERRTTNSDASPRSSSLVVRRYEDVPGFCKSATLDDIRGHGYVLTPGRYVGAAEVEDDGEPFDEKMARLTAELDAQFAESARMEAEIRRNLRGLGL